MNYTMREVLGNNFPFLLFPWYVYRLHYVLRPKTDLKFIRKLASVKSLKVNVSNVSPSSERKANA